MSSARHISLVARGLAVLAALAACLWFANGIRQAHDVNAAAAAINDTPRLSAREVSRITSLLDAAAVLNPDTTVQVLRAEVQGQLGRVGRAQAILRQVVRAEPLNIRAWAAAARYAPNRRTDVTAFRHLVTLEPPVPPPH